MTFDECLQSQSLVHSVTQSNEEYDINSGTTSDDDAVANNFQKIPNVSIEPEQSISSSNGTSLSSSQSVVRVRFDFF